MPPRKSQQRRARTGQQRVVPVVSITTAKTNFERLLLLDNSSSSDDTERSAGAVHTSGTADSDVDDGDNAKALAAASLVLRLLGTGRSEQDDRGESIGGSALSGVRTHSSVDSDGSCALATRGAITIMIGCWSGAAGESLRATTLAEKYALPRSVVFSGGDYVRYNKSPSVKVEQSAGIDLSGAPVVTQVVSTALAKTGAVGHLAFQHEDHCKTANNFLPSPCWLFSHSGRAQDGKGPLHSGLADGQGTAAVGALRNQMNVIRKLAESSSGDDETPNSDCFASLDVRVLFFGGGNVAGQELQGFLEWPTADDSFPPNLNLEIGVFAVSSRGFPGPGLPFSHLSDLIARNKVPASWQVDPLHPSPGMQHQEVWLQLASRP